MWSCDLKGKQMNNQWDARPQKSLSLWKLADSAEEAGTMATDRGLPLEEQKGEVPDLAHLMILAQEGVEAKTQVVLPRIKELVG